jgi:hypothetical protein
MRLSVAVRFGVAALALLVSASLATRAEDTRPLISHLDQELHRLVIVSPDSGSIYLYAVNTDELKLLAFRNMTTDRDSVKRLEPKTAAEPAKLPDADVPGQDLADVPRPVASRRVAVIMRENSDSSSVELSYHSLEPLVKLYDQLIAGFASWKITSRQFDTRWEPKATIEARRGAVSVSIFLGSNRSGVTDVRITRTEKNVGN